MVARLAPLGALLLAGCVIPIPVPVPLGAERWRLGEAGGATLAAEGRLALACRPDGTLAATAPGVTPVASNEEFALGTPRDAVLLVAEVEGATGPGVTATGPIPRDFLDDLEATGEVSAVYGTERVGPLRPPAAALATFVARCRALEQGGPRPASQG